MKYPEGLKMKKENLKKRFIGVAQDAVFFLGAIFGILLMIIGIGTMKILDWLEEKFTKSA
jgi:hypothetical protein